MLARILLRIIVCTQSGQVAHIWRWRAKRSSELSMRLASWPELENTRFRVRLTCDCVRHEHACFKIDSGLPCWQSMAEYGTGYTYHGDIDATKKNRFINPMHFAALELLSPYCLGDLGYEESIRYLLGQVHTDGLWPGYHKAHTYLIPSRGTRESIPLEEVVHPTGNRRRVSGEIVLSSNAFLYLEQKRGSYCRVSGAYLSHLVSTHDEYVKFEYHRPLTILMLGTDGSILPASDMSSRACSQTRWTSDINTAGAGRGFTNRVYHRIRVLARTITAASAPLAVFRRGLESGQM